MGQAPSRVSRQQVWYSDDLLRLTDCADLAKVVELVESQMRGRHRTVDVHFADERIQAHAEVGGYRLALRAQGTPATGTLQRCRRVTAAVQDILRDRGATRCLKRVPPPAKRGSLGSPIVAKRQACPSAGALSSISANDGERPARLPNLAPAPVHPRHPHLRCTQYGGDLFHPEQDRCLLRPRRPPRSQAPGRNPLEIAPTTEVAR